MYAVEVTRHAGSAHGHYFDHAVALLKSNGEVDTFDEEESAQQWADFYNTEHALDTHAICRKTYKVVTV